MKKIYCYQKQLLAILVFLVLGLAKSSSAYPQRPVPLIDGSASPDFSLQVYQGGKGTPVTKTLSAYKGRWLLLDFWTTTCIACIKGFPKVQMLADSLAEKLDVILVGKNDPKYNKGIQQMYSRIAAEQQLRLTTAFDTTIFKDFRVWATPHVALISPTGKVQKLELGSALSCASLTALMEGHPKPVSQKNVNIPTKIRIDSSKGLAHRSELAGRTGKDFGAANQVFASKGQFITHLANLSQLYMLASTGWTFWGGRDSIYGKWWTKPLLELSDTTAFVSNFNSGKGLYRYHIKMEDTAAKPPAIMTAMKKDLADWFGYSARIEVRDMPIWKLVSSSPETAKKLASRAAEQHIEVDHSRLVLRKSAVQQLMQRIRAYQSNKIVFDETGLRGTIDLELNASLANFISLQKALRANGLDLVPATRPMKVLIISEK